MVDSFPPHPTSPVFFCSPCNPIVNKKFMRQAKRVLYPMSINSAIMVCIENRNIYSSPHPGPPPRLIPKLLQRAQRDNSNLIWRQVSKVRGNSVFGFFFFASKTEQTTPPTVGENESQTRPTALLGWWKHWNYDLCHQYIRVSYTLRTIHQNPSLPSTSSCVAVWLNTRWLSPMLTIYKRCPAK